MSRWWRSAILAAVGAASLQIGPQAQQPMTLQGEIVEVSCYTKLGIDKATGASHAACARECAAKGQALGILTDGEGLIKITGDYSADNYARLAQHIGRQVEVTGTPDRFLDYSRAIRVTKVAPIRSPSR